MDVGGELCPKTAQREIFLVFVKCDRSVRSTQKTAQLNKLGRGKEGEERGGMDVPPKGKKSSWACRMRDCRCELCSALLCSTRQMGS